MKQLSKKTYPTILQQPQENLPQLSLQVRRTNDHPNCFYVVILGTKFLTKQLATGVVMMENLIGQVSKNVHDKIVPNPEPVKVNKGLHVTARGLRTTSGVAVKASNYVGK